MFSAQLETCLDTDIDKAGVIYFSHRAFTRTVEMLCMNKFLTLDQLREWATAYETWQILHGLSFESPKEYAKHFPEWLKFQNLKSDPKTLNNVTENPKSGFNARSNTPEANNNRKREADDQLDRLFGNG